MAKKVLHIITSPRGKASVSKKLGNAIIDNIKTKYPGSFLKERDLTKDRYPHLEEVHISSFFTPVENRSPEQLEALKHSDQAIAELQDADIIVIDTPLYNFSITSTLKSWIDHIARAGITFRYTERGPEGLIKNKKVYLAFTSGGIYSEGALQAYDFVVPYLRKTLGFLGMTDISLVRAEGLSIPAVQDTALQKGIERIVID